MGGGIIRTAAKAAIGGAFRPSIVDQIGRRASRQQVSSFVPAVEQGGVVPTLSTEFERSDVPAVAVAAIWPEIEFDEWELTGGSDKSFDSAGVPPRQVFGPVPTLEEAQEATADVKDALEKVYFTPQHTLEPICQSTAYGECSTVSLAPKHVTQMFSLLKSSEAQDVVASLASDENIWKAVMNNEKVLQFCKNSPPPAAFTATFMEPAESVAESNTQEDVKETSKGSFLNDIKVKISNMVSSISDFVKDLFGKSKSESSSSCDMPDSNTMTYGAFLALAVMVIMTIFLKRA